MTGTFFLIGDIFAVIVIALSVLSAVSFTLFIRRLLINASIRRSQNDEISKKLDKIIDMLERN